jgi:hypothetical protein
MISKIQNIESYLLSPPPNLGITASFPKFLVFRNSFRLKSSVDKPVIRSPRAFGNSPVPAPRDCSLLREIGLVRPSPKAARSPETGVTLKFCLRRENPGRA